MKKKVKIRIFEVRRATVYQPKQSVIFSHLMEVSVILGALR